MNREATSERRDLEYGTSVPLLSGAPEAPESNRLQAVFDDFAEKVAMARETSAQPFGVCRVFTHRLLGGARL